MSGCAKANLSCNSLLAQGSVRFSRLIISALFHLQLEFNEGNQEDGDARQPWVIAAGVMI
jgi:hypothetical protein